MTNPEPPRHDSDGSSVDRSLLDEAIRLGERAAKQADKQRDINRAAVEAIYDSISLIKSGRVLQARERLEKAILTITRISGAGLEPRK